MIRSVIDRWKHGWMMKQRREINVFNIEAKMYKHMESLVNRVEEVEDRLQE